MLRNESSEIDSDKQLADHRALGEELELYSISERVGPGLVLWHPKGAFVREALEEFWRKQHRVAGYDLVSTPHIGKSGLWETSGHLEHYREAMFASMDVDSQSYYAKPMNCPFHMEIFASRSRSYRELAVRYAELGTVYRYERSGVLHGLLRVRGFTQDDAHVFCRPDQVEAEIVAALKLALRFLRALGFDEPQLSLSTRPSKSVGLESSWEQATQSLIGALDELGSPYKMDPGGGAFYGPKVDVHVEDSAGRQWQLSTVQFDFHLPERFRLGYIGSDGAKHQPIVIHRALFGSLERFFGILVEHFQGAFPVWLAPTQVIVLPVSGHQHFYVEGIVDVLSRRGLRIEADARNEPLAARIRDAEMAKIPFQLVVGRKEQESRTVSVRARGGESLGEDTVEGFASRALAASSAPS